jgi:hypothetical protein
MTDRGEILNRSLSEIRLSPDGASMQLFLTDAIPPHGTAVLTCENVPAFHLHRTDDDETPYFIGEVKWQSLTDAGQAQELGRLGYSFFNGSGVLLPDLAQVISLHFEGSVCGDIICGDCSLRDEPSAQYSSSGG